MQNRILINLAVVLLFAIAQMGIAMHSVEHVNGHTVVSDSDSPLGEHSADELCGQCLAQSHADFAHFQASFVWASIAHTQYLSTYSVAKLVFNLVEYFSARAPPYFL